MYFFCKHTRFFIQQCVLAIYDVAGIVLAAEGFDQ